jgi:cobaltochelatase CobN
MKRSGSVSVCALLLACVLLIMVASASYPMFHYDVQRTGNVSGDAPMTNDRLWSTDLGGFVDSSPIVSDGRVYASNWEMGVGDYGLYCLDEQTGTTIWKNPLNGGEGSASTAAISGDKIFVGSKNGHIYCINASSGETIWNKRIEHSPAWWGVASSPLVYENENMVFVTTFSNNASNNGTLHVLDFNGSELWSISTGDIFYYTSPAIAEGNVFFAGNLTNHTLYCVNISTHNILWLFNTSTQIKSTPAIWNNTVFFASEDRMYTIDVFSGEEIWNNSFSCVMSSPAVSNGKVYIGSSDKKMYCYDGLTGVELWNCSVDGVIQSSPVIANDTVFFGTSVFGAVADGTVYALNTTDGSIIWSYCINQCVMSSPAVSDGILFIGADDGRVYAFGEKPAITAKIRIEGKNETIWSGEVTFSSSTIVDTNGTLHHILYPSAVGALDEASKKGNFSYEVIYYPTYDALYVKSIANESDWWHYWVNYTLPNVGADKYEIKEGDYVLWGHSESWTPSPLKMSLEKDIVKINETFNVTVFNVSANITTPLENTTVYVDSLNYSTNEEGNATISLGEVGLYEVYAEKDGVYKVRKGRNPSIVEYSHDKRPD